MRNTRKKEKRKEKKRSWDSLYKEAYGLWKDVCFERDGMVCQVQKVFGQYSGIVHSETLQVDHCFSRGNHVLHLETRNGTVVCSACNMGKAHGNTPSGYLISKIVEAREGAEFLDMLNIFQSKQVNLYWRKKWWMEDKVLELKKELEKIKALKGKSI